MDQHGVDVTRLAMFFTAPSEREVLWSEDGITGVQKFALNRLWPLLEAYRGTSPDLKQHFKQDSLTEDERTLYVKLNQTIKRVTDDCERLQFNTAIAALMELTRDFEPNNVTNDTLNDFVILKTIQLVAPLAPHMAEEMWHRVGFETTIFLSDWPEFDTEAVTGDTIKIAVQINGKLRDTITVEADAEQEGVEKIAFESEKVAAHTSGKTIMKAIYVKGRILNLVVKG